MEGQICNLCFNVIKETKFTVIDDVIIGIFNFVLQTLNCEDRSSHMMCHICSEKLFAAFKFKSTCIYTDGTIMDYVNCEKDLPLDITDINIKEMEKKGLNTTLNDQEVCRLCMQMITDEFVSVREVNAEMIHSCIPEVNFGITRDPLICKTCFNSLYAHADFLESCLNAQRKSKNKVYNKEMELASVVSPFGVHVKNEDVEMTLDEDKQEPGVSIKSEEVHINSEECKQESLDPFLSLEREGITDSCGLTYGEKLVIESKVTSLVKAEICKLGKLSSRSNLTGRQMRHGDMSQAQKYKCKKIVFRSGNKEHFLCHQPRRKDASEVVPMYKCNECDHKTRHKYNLAKHRLTHKKISKMQIYKCKKCVYESKHKGYFARHELTHNVTFEVQMYKCYECDYQSKHKRNFLKHLLTHRDTSQVPMYKCNECDYQNKHKNNFLKHQLTHRDASEVQMYKCNECDFQTKFDMIFINHMLKHRVTSEVQMYKCNECDYQNKHKRNFLKHLFTHRDTSEVPMYKCNECDYQNKHKKNFLEHQLTHRDISELQMYKCNECDFQTEFNMIFIDHLLKHRVSTEVQIDKCMDRHNRTEHERPLVLNSFMGSKVYEAVKISDISIGNSNTGGGEESVK